MFTLANISVNIRASISTTALSMVAISTPFTNFIYQAGFCRGIAKTPKTMVGDPEHRVVELGDRVGKCQEITGLHVYDDLPYVPYQNVRFREKDLAPLLGSTSLLGRYTKVLQGLLEFA